ncbi:MAG TPA: RcnB family protein [Phenylobacterium sp.]|jgi:Ni/Co efflux regulator RcnB|uniref:RcnB family protein n=1 Tax=Phenylobacterium sp. TaxID=1871053 RepID=UPI002BA41990|nr:RcnB family protein [Phenylobacterium sp.]
MKTVIMTAALALAFAAPSVGQAHPKGERHYYAPHAKGPPHAKGAHRAKGHPHGMPPGQARKAWRQGQYMPRTYVVERTYYVVEPQRYNLRPAPAGYRWVRVDGDVYLAQTQTGLIAEVVRNLIQ